MPVVPKIGLAVRASRILVARLRSGSSMQVKQDPEVMLPAEINDVIQPAKSVFLPLPWGKIGLKVPVVERQADKRKTGFREERDIILRDIAVHVRIEEGRVALVSQHPAELLADLPLRPGQPDHVVLDQHPAPEVDATKADRLAAFNNLQTARLQNFSRRGGTGG